MTSKANRCRNIVIKAKSPSYAPPISGRFFVVNFSTEVSMLMLLGRGLNAVLSILNFLFLTADDAQTGQYAFDDALSTSYTLKD